MTYSSGLTNQQPHNANLKEFTVTLMKQNLAVLKITQKP